MTSDPVARQGPPAAPRPGIVKALGILNIIFTIPLAAYALWSVMVLMAVVMADKPDDGAVTATEAKSAMTAMTGPAMIRFGLVDVATSIPLQVVMFASGIGLLNLRRWGATWWTWGCWAKIARLIALGSYFLFAVVPPLSTAMGRSVIVVIRQQQKGGGAGGPSLEQLTMIYMVMFSVLGGAMMVFGVIYPAVSLWLLGRPGVKAALSQASTTSAAPYFDDGLAKEATPP